MFFGTVALSTPYVAIILLGVISAWMVSVRSLGHQFDNLIAHQATLKDPDEELSKEPVLAESSNT